MSEAQQVARPAGDAELDEPRLFLEAGIAARVAQVCAPVLRDLGFRLVRVKMLATNGCTVQIMAERGDGIFTIDDCETVSRALSPALDVADPIKQAYHLEISSPGIDRPLMRVSDFARWQGHEAKLALNGAIEGRRRFRGQLSRLERDGVMVALPAEEMGQDTHIHIPFALMSEAKLVLTDALIAESLRRDKANAQGEDPSLHNNATPDNGLARPGKGPGKRSKPNGR